MSIELLSIVDACYFFHHQRIRGRPLTCVDFFYSTNELFLFCYSARMNCGLFAVFF